MWALPTDASDENGEEWGRRGEESRMQMKKMIVIVIIALIYLCKSNDVNNFVVPRSFHHRTHVVLYFFKYQSISLTIKLLTFKSATGRICLISMILFSSMTNGVSPCQVPVCSYLSLFPNAQCNNACVSPFCACCRFLWLWESMWNEDSIAPNNRSPSLYRLNHDDYSPALSAQSASENAQISLEMLPILLFFFPLASTALPSFPIIRTSYGAIRGYEYRATNGFVGEIFKVRYLWEKKLLAKFINVQKIPYASPPIGPRRWKKPVPPEPRNYTIDGTLWEFLSWIIILVITLLFHEYSLTCSERSAISIFQFRSCLRSTSYLLRRLRNGILRGLSPAQHLHIEIIQRSETYTDIIYIQIPFQSNASCPVVLFIHGGNALTGGTMSFPDETLVTNFASQGAMTALGREIIVHFMHHHGNCSISTGSIRCDVIGRWECAALESVLAWYSEIRKPTNTFVLDVLEAVHFTRREIHNFGGDKDQVLIGHFL